MLRAAVHTDLHARAASPRPVCDDDRTHCVTPFAYLASAPHRANNRTSSPHRHAARWRDDERVLTPIFEAVLNGSCTERVPTAPGVAARRRVKTVVEVGAGLGVVGLYLAKRGCRVHAIEPLALQAAALRLAIERNALHLMRVHRAAISTAAKPHAWLAYTLDKAGGAHTARLVDRPLPPPRRPNATHGTAPPSYTHVNALTLDALYRSLRLVDPRRGQGVVDLLRVDAGDELDILASGAAIALPHTRQLLLAIDQSGMRRKRGAGGAVMQLRALLERAHFAPSPSPLPSTGGAWSWHDAAYRYKRVPHAWFVRRA